MLHTRFIYRQLTSSLNQTIVFVACVALSIVTLVSLGGFGESVNDSLLRDARALLAADLVVESGFAYEQAMTAEIEQLRGEPGIDVSRTYEFISVVRLPESDKTQVSELKVVEPGYPFYGTAVLESGRPFGEVLQPGSIIVGQALLDQLQIKIGDEVAIGAQTLMIADVLLSEPDTPIDFFNLGPRIFVHAADLESLELVKPGSLVQYRTLFKVADNGQVDTIADRLETVAEPDRERVDTYLTNQSAAQRFFEDFLTFLSLIGIFTLMLAGIGIQSSLTSFLKEREDTIAILRTFGAKGKFVITQYFVVAVILGLIGIVLGLILGLVLQFAFPVLFASFLPPRVEFVLSARSLIEGVVLGFFVVTAFTFIPLYNLQELKPNFIFRRETIPANRGWLYYSIIAMIFVFFAGMVFWYLQNPERTAYFAGGVVGLVAITAGLTRLILLLLKRQKIKSLAPRQALRGLFRPRNSTAAIIVTLATSLAVLFTIFLLERNLNESFVQAYPDDAPNMFLIDIQPGQEEAVAAELEVETEFFPIIVGRINSVNDLKIVQKATSRTGEDDANGGPGDNQNGDQDGGPRLEGEQSITYRNVLREGETLIAGQSLFLDDSAEMAQVSVREGMLEAYDFKIGDVIEFNIQGLAIQAQVTSIYARPPNEEDFSPPFRFVFREQDLKAAPQTIVATVNVPADQVSDIQSRLVNTFPNITVIDVSSAIAALAELVGNLTIIIRFFTLFSILAGLFIVISSVLATRFARIQEAVYFKVLGAKQKFVFRVFTLENIFIGLVSGLLALFLSQLAGWAMVTQVFDLDYIPFIGSSFILVIMTVLIVTIVGLLASVSILRHKPIVYLRESTAE
ncbi:MAG: putative ABC transport system permease protein [Candidatus Promineifilaceae bacterium]|jgi:putative ABC transport system permease protein